MIFNWGYNSAYGGEGDTRHRIVNPSAGKWYVAENYVEGSAAVSADNWAGGVQTREGNPEALKLNEPWDAMAIRQESAKEAYRRVLKDAGATLPKRDAVDARILHEVATGTARFGNNGIIDSQDEVGGWPHLASSPAPNDADGDGMADFWEDAHGLDSKSADDRNATTLDPSYTNLEVYLNSLADLSDSKQEVLLVPPDT